MDRNERTRRFYELVWPHRADVLRVAQFLSRSRVTAEDLAQDTLLKAFRGIDRLEAGPGVKAWLLQILRNTWLDRMRANSGRPAEVSLSELPVEPESETSSESDAAASWGDPRSVLEAFSDQQVIEALQSLPAEIRWTLLLVDVEGLSLHDSADALDVPAGTIKSRVHRGRQMLREKLLPLAKELRWVPDDVDEPSSPTEES